MIRKYIPVVYVNDKDLYDPLMAARKRITNEILVEMMKKRGILLSEKESRDYLIDYISIMNHSYNDYDHITDFLQSSSRTEKTTSFIVDVDVAPEEMKQIFNELKSEREERDEIYTLQSERSDKFEINVEYAEFDLSKTTLKQRRQKEALIEIEKIADSKYQVRTPANEKMTEITTLIMRNLEKIKNKEFIPQVIDLMSVVSAKHRTDFFLNLLNSLDGFQHDTVTFIDVHPDPASQTIDDDEDLDDGGEGQELAQEFLIYVKKASIDGYGLLNSDEYQHLTERGFFISNIVWHAIEKKSKGAKVEFQALLNDPKNGSDFRYSVRGKFSPNRSGSGFTATKRPLDNGEKLYFTKKLEIAAQIAYEKVIFDYNKETGNQNETD